MIQLITKEEYYKNTSEVSTYYKVYRDLKFSFDPNVVLYPTEVYLLVDNEFFVAYLPSLHYLFIPVKYNKEDVIEKIKAEEVIYMTDWVITKVSEGVSFPLNVFYKNDVDISISKSDVELIKGENKGSWNLINERTKEVIYFELLHSWELSQSVSNYIAFEEKAEIPMNREKVFEKSKFIELLIHGCKKGV